MGSQQCIVWTHVWTVGWCFSQPFACWMQQPLRMKHQSLLAALLCRWDKGRGPHKQGHEHTTCQQLQLASGEGARAWHAAQTMDIRAMI